MDGKVINYATFASLLEKVGRFDVTGKTLLLPEMSKASEYLLAATFRSFGVNAQIMETYTGLKLGKEFTSGKECFPCQVTLGDILYHLMKEKERLGDAFDASRYVYFLPEADGPCRFGMYNKLQRIVLDSFPEFQQVPIAYLSTKDGYAIGGLLPAEKARHFRRTAYVAMVAGDVWDRTLWRVRPYEKESGAMDRLYEEGLETMARVIEECGHKKDFPTIRKTLRELVYEARNLIDPGIPRKPRIGIVGEIYLRCHTKSNQDIIRLIEKYGGEVVNASMSEWINYITYDTALKARQKWKMALRLGQWKDFYSTLKRWSKSVIEYYYQLWRQGQVYRAARIELDISPDHAIGPLEDKLGPRKLFCFDVGTEAALSIAGALAYAEHGFNGVVNVFPFTCMPSTATSAVLKPLLQKLRIPYIDSAYDGTYQPNRDAIVRTFMYQAYQHQKKQRENGTAYRYHSGKDWYFSEWLIQ